MTKISHFKFQLRSNRSHISNWLPGFTVIELLVYMGLLAVFLTIISQIFVASIDTQLESEAESSVQQDSKFILARLHYDLANATAVIEPSSPGSSSSRLEFVADGVTTIYEPQGVNVTVTVGADTYQLNSVNTTVSNLFFARRGVANGKPIITTAFTLTSRAVRNSGPEIQTFQTTIGIR